MDSCKPGRATAKSQDYVPAKRDTTRSIAPYFTPATTTKKTPDAEGFIQRWLLLEPINKPNRQQYCFYRQLHKNSIYNRVFSKPVYCSSKRWRKGKSWRSGTNVACIGEHKFQCQTISFCLWVKKTDIRSSVLGSNRCQQSARNEKCKNGSRVKFSINVVAEWKGSSDTFRRQTHGNG